MAPKKIAARPESGSVVQLSLGFDRALPPVWEYFRQNSLLMIGTNEKTKKLVKHIRKGTAVIVAFPKKQGGSGVVGLGTVTEDVVTVFENKKFNESDEELTCYRHFMQDVYANPSNKPTKKFRPYNKQFKTHRISMPKKAIGISADSSTWDVGRARWSDNDAYAKMSSMNNGTITMERVRVKWEATTDFDKGFSSLSPPGTANKVHLAPLLSICPRKLPSNVLACIASKLKGVALGPAPASKRPLSSDIAAVQKISNDSASKRVRAAANDMWALLDRLGLLKYADMFAKEEIDIHALKLLSESDLKGLGLPLGPRRKLQAAT